MDENVDVISLYRQQPTPQNLYKAVQDYSSTIDYITQSIVGKSSPIIKDRARLLAADAVKTYDPATQVPFKSWLRQSLMPISRISREVTEVISVPERVRRDRSALLRAREELYDELDREPSEMELADRTGIPVKRQKKLNGSIQGVRSESAFSASAVEGEGESADPSVKAFDPNKEWEDYVYNELEDTDKIIFNGLTGYNGAPVVKGIDLAAKLKLSPAAITKRAKLIQARLDSNPTLRDNAWLP